MQLTLSKSEVQTMVLAISTAIEKESRAIQLLQGEVRQFDIREAMTQRVQHVKELDRLREKLTRS